MRNLVLAGATVMTVLAMVGPGAALGQEAEKFSPQYQTCMDKADGVTTAMHGCIAAEIIVQDKRLNANYSAT